jgi:hypothetical protein
MSGDLPLSRRLAELAISPAGILSSIIALPCALPECGVNTGMRRCITLMHTPKHMPLLEGHPRRNRIGNQQGLMGAHDAIQSTEVASGKF